MLEQGWSGWRKCVIMEVAFEVLHMFKSPLVKENMMPASQDVEIAASSEAPCLRP